MDDFIIGEEVDLGFVEVLPGEDFFGSSNEVIEHFGLEGRVVEINKKRHGVLLRQPIIHTTLITKTTYLSPPMT